MRPRLLLLGLAVAALAPPPARAQAPAGGVVEAELTRLDREWQEAVVKGDAAFLQAHTADEWVSLAEVEQAAEILFRFVCA